MSPTYTIHDMPTDERPRERFAQVGAAGLSSAELLAIILRTGNRGESVVRMAERVLATFDGLPGVARASLKELQQVNGIGPAKATEMQAALELGRRLLATMPKERPQIKSPADAANLLMSEMAFLEQEHLRVLLLDTRNRVISIPTVYIGSLNASIVRVGELFRPAIKENAAAIVIAHNHPSGDPSPSPEDIRMTKAVKQAGELLNIDLLDHIVIGRNRFVSLKERGLGF
ncbi:MAG TPA: JAB domain-containing protein [Anaerolineae bacterium]|nr:JAB domain-containing protein [Anaerolineae bacterium]